MCVRACAQCGARGYACVMPVHRYGTCVCVTHKPFGDRSGTGVPCPHPGEGQPWSSGVWWGRKQEALRREASVSVLGAGATRLLGPAVPTPQPAGALPTTSHAHTHPFRARTRPGILWASGELPPCFLWSEVRSSATTAFPSSFPAPCSGKSPDGSRGTARPTGSPSPHWPGRLALALCWGVRLWKGFMAGPREPLGPL